MSEGDTRVPMVDLTRQYREIAGEMDRAVAQVLSSGTYILGPEVNAFEREMSDYIGAAQGVGVASGTDSLYLILRALGIGPGDEVITTAFTFIATADSIERTGATPVFADIDPATFNLDPRSAAGRVTGRTKAIVVVHLYGQPADPEPLLEMIPAGIELVEDCAQAHGATLRGRKVGTFGKASAFSFFPTKTLGGVGDGGMVCTDDEGLAGTVRMLRIHGSRRKYEHEQIGLNSRLDELQAAVLRVKLRRLDAWNSERKRIAAVYDESLAGVVTPCVVPGAEHVYHLYTVRSDRRDELASVLKRAGVASNVYYPIPLHLQPCFTGLGYAPGDLPFCERAASEALSLPIFPGMTNAEIEQVCKAVNSAAA